MSSKFNNYLTNKAIFFLVVKGFALLNPPLALPLDPTGPSALDPTRAAALDPLGVYFYVRGFAPAPHRGL